MAVFFLMNMFFFVPLQNGSWGSVLLIIFYVENLDVESWGVKNDV